jgi:hypothetical protein
MENVVKVEGFDLPPTATTKEVASAIGVPENVLSDYVQTGEFTTKNAKYGRKILRIINKNRGLFGLEAQEQVISDPIGWGAAVKKNPWIQSETDAKNWFKKLTNENKSYLQNTKTNKTLFNNIKTTREKNVQ